LGTSVTLGLSGFLWLVSPAGEFDFFQNGAARGMFYSIPLSGLTVMALMGIPESRELWMKVIKTTNPVAIAWWICYGIVVLGIWKGVPAVAEFVRKKAPLLYRFGVRVFVLAHSDIRLLCAIDAAIGACVGYRLENPIAGSIIGGLLGVANFYLVKPIADRLGETVKAKA